MSERIHDGAWGRQIREQAERERGQRLPLTVERRVVLLHDRETGEPTGYFEIPAIQLVADGRIKNLKAGQTVRITIDELKAR